MEHCDFVPLRNMLIRTHLQDLRDVTNYIYYENFKCRKLAGVTETDKVRIIKKSMRDYLLAQVPNKNPLLMMEEEQKEHIAKLNIAKLL